MSKKIVFIAKTNLNNDGRILNEIKILKDHFKDRVFIDFLLLADKPTQVDFKELFNLIEIKTFVRNSSLLRICVVIEFVLRAIVQLIKIKPDIIHAEDLAIVLPVYLYKKIFKRSVVVIYDDHEMPNEDEGVQFRIFQWFEVKLMKKSDVVIYANKERQEVLENLTGISNGSYLLNLPFFEDLSDSIISEKYQGKLNYLEGIKKSGRKLIIHQGSLEVERGRLILKDLINRCCDDELFVFVGGSKNDYDKFINDFSVDIKKVYFVGSVPYIILDHFWKLCDASIVMYLPKLINNRLCAPNRFFIGLKNNLPIVVNKDNPVLNNFIETYRCGVYVEDILMKRSLDDIFAVSYDATLLSNIIGEEKKKFVDLYERFV